MNYMQLVFDSGLFPDVLAKLTEEDAAALCLTCKTAVHLSKELPHDFAWLAADDLETALARIRTRVDFGSPHNPWSRGRYWQQALVLVARFLHRMRAAGVLCAKVNSDSGMLAWNSFRIVEDRERDWRAEVLEFAKDTSIFKYHNMVRYRYDVQHPTELVFQLLADLGFERVFARRIVLPVTLPTDENQALQHDKTYFRHWIFFGTEKFDEDIKRELQEMSRARDLYDVFCRPKRAKLGPS